MRKGTLNERKALKMRLSVEKVQNETVLSLTSCLHQVMRCFERVPKIR
jgi:hypothetical protein